MKWDHSLWLSACVAMVCSVEPLPGLLGSQVGNQSFGRFTHDENHLYAPINKGTIPNTNLDSSSILSNKMTSGDHTQDFMRPRAFSDASVSSGGHYGYLRKLKDKIGQVAPMKVIVCRESEHVAKESVYQTEGKSSAIKKDRGRPLSSRSHAQLSRSRSVHGREDFDDSVPPPKPKLPENYRPFLAFAQNVQVTKEFCDAVDDPAQIRQNAAAVSKDGKTSNAAVRNKSEEPKRTLEAFVANQRKTEYTYKDDKNSQANWESVSKPRRNSSTEGTKSFSVLYRYHDSKYQSELLKKELDELRTSEFVKKNSETVRQRLSSTDNTQRSPGGRATDFKKQFGDMFIKQTSSVEVDAATLKSYNSVDKIGSKNAISRAYPQSGAQINQERLKNQRQNFAQSRTDSKPLEPRRMSQNRGSAQKRSRSESVLHRNNTSEIVELENKLSASKNYHQLSKSASNLKRKQDTIRKFNKSSFEPKREKVKTDFYKNFKSRDLKPDSVSSDEDDDRETRGTSKVSSGSKVVDSVRNNKAYTGARLNTDRAIGDNRSDEEKYAALSRIKIVHSKSSSLDSQVPKDKRYQSDGLSEKLRLLLADDIGAKIDLEVRRVEQNIKANLESDLRKLKTHKLPSDSQSQSSSDSIERFYLKENQRGRPDNSNSDLPFSDSECVVNKGTRNSNRSDFKLTSSSKSSSTSSVGKVILRQCRIGTSVAFGLYGVQEGNDSEKPNGNGYLDGQGLVTIRMIPDEQGRFGFNVKGGADQGMPIIVSRVAPNTPADNAIPRLNEGDQVLFINGRDVSQHTHEQVVMFIRASRETHSGELVLKVRPNAYSGEENSEDPDLIYDPETHHITSASGGNALDLSLKLLQESLESGAALAQFEQLYRKKPGMTMNAARQEANIPKNRYRDISPYDQTRVIMKNGVNGDYINANYVNMEIPVSGIVNRYIAAQGPLPTTCIDFWQMIWEQQSTLVVMLTTKVERGRIKCHQYWPDLYETSDYGHLQITCMKEEETDSFAFREFNLTHVELQEERHISHMQYIAWPDHGVPDDPADFLDFVIKVRQKRVGLVEPSIVHCSAGIGRTGVLITMETAMCLIEANQPVYPLSIVRQMRDQRAMLIQTPNQYKFVCEAILRCFNEGIVKPSSDYQQR